MSAGAVDVLAVRLPSVPQMLVRMQQGHRTMLTAIRDGRRIEVRTDGEARGFRTVAATLSGWGCVRNGVLTDRGNALLDAALAAQEARRHV